MEVEVLTAGSAARWFAVVPDMAASAEALRHEDALLASGPLWPHMRMVVTQQGAPFGRMAAEVKDDLIRMWNPTFRDATSTSDRRAAMRLMLRRVTAARTDAGLRHLAIESRPGDDLPDNGLWLQALEQEGFLQTCVYHAHVLALDRGRAPGLGRTPGLSIQTVDADREKDLVALYRRAKAQTLEQRDAYPERAEQAVADMKTLGRGHDPSTWLVAYVGDSAAGYALANLADDPQFEQPSAWLIDVGCVPERRGSGIATALLDELLGRVAAAGAWRVLAAIDDVNLPSRRLHASFGFTPLDDRHYVYRLPAEP